MKHRKKELQVNLHFSAASWFVILQEIHSCWKIHCSNSALTCFTLLAAPNTGDKLPWRPRDEKSEISDVHVSSDNQVSITIPQKCLTTLLVKHKHMISYKLTERKMASDHSLRPRLHRSIWYTQHGIQYI